MNPQILDFARPVASIAFAATLWLAQQVTPEVPGVPSWVTALGLPVAMLVAVVYALVSTNNALRKSEAGRLEDRDSFIEKLEKDAEKANASHELLIRATDAQTTEFRRLADNLQSRPCQKP